MKMCPTCGLSVPDNVNTSHHPVPCFPGCFCNQKGNSTEGCIWNQTITGEAAAPETMLAYLKLIIARERAQTEFLNQEKKN